MAIRLYYDKKASLVGKTVYFAPGKRLAKDRELVEREYHAGDHTVDREQLLDGTPCVVTAQTPNAAFVFVSWQSISGLQFSARLPLRFFRDTLSEYPYRDIYAKAKRDAVLAKLKAEQAAAASPSPPAACARAPLSSGSALATPRSGFAVPAWLDGGRGPDDAMLCRCSVGQLKQEIAARGLSAAGAIEKSDLIRLLEQPVRYVRRSIPQQR